MPASAEPGLTVAVTGPTGEIGKSFVAALERAPEVGRVIGMARRRFDPVSHGWTKVEYRRGDILDRGAVAALVADADVVVHLAFVIVAGSGRSREINLVGSRNVFEAAAVAGARRLVYTSSVADCGFHADAPPQLTEDVPARGTERYPYSAQKAEAEMAFHEVLTGSPTEGYVFRPCIVAGPAAPLLIDSIPLIALERKLPRSLRGALGRVPGLRPVMPDPGVPFQLVHHDDVAAALCAGVLGAGPPGTYNLASPGQVTISDVAHELGWHAVPVPGLTVEIGAELVARLPRLPNWVHWIEALRRPVLMDSSRAERELGWTPTRPARQILGETVAAAR